MRPPIRYHEYYCKTALSQHSGQFWRYDLNPYRGCAHGCLYCYALYSHEYLLRGDFFQDVYVKINIAEKLEQALSSKAWRPRIINLGGVTDSYQPIEAHYRLMPEILKVLIRHRNPVILSTKSDLPLRDYGLLCELAGVTDVGIAATVTTMDEGLQKRIEPGAVSPKRRMEMLRAFSKAGIRTGVHVMPIIPHITDSKENLTAICAAAKEARVSYVLPGALHLRGATRGAFFAAVKEQFPEAFPKLLELYKKGRLSPAYKTQLYAWLHPLLKKMGLSQYPFPAKTRRPDQPPQQLTFF